MGNTTNLKYREYYEAFIKSRKDYYWAWVYSIIAYIFALVLFFYCIMRFSYFHLRIAEELWSVIVAGPAAALSPLVFKATVDVRRKYKKLLVWSAMEKVFSYLHVQPDEKLSYAELQAAGLHVDVNAKQNDWFCGNYNGVLFILCDVMQMRFKGRILIVELDKAFLHRVTVVQKGFPKNKQDTEDLQTMVIDNSIFMDNFVCYAENAKQAEEILTPQIVQALNLVAAATDGKLHVTFCGYRIFVSVHDKRDAFEPPLFRKFDLEQEMKNVYIQIRQITDLIEAVTGQNHTENLQSTD